MVMVSSVSSPLGFSNMAVGRAFFFMYSFFSRSRMVLVWFRDGWEIKRGSEKGR